MKIEDAKITHIDSRVFVELNGELLEGVKGYKITSSSEGAEELELKIDITGANIRYESLTS